MKNRNLFVIFALSVFILSAVVVSSNPGIMNYKENNIKIHDKVFKGEKVNRCIYCHRTAGLKKEKQGLRIGQKNYKSLKKNKYCAGSGCH